MFGDHVNGYQGANGRCTYLGGYTAYPGLWQTMEIMMEYEHTPVMMHEVLEALNLKFGDTVIDATLGGGGHSMAILKKIGDTGILFSIDRDIEAITNAKEKFRDHNNFHPIHANFRDLNKVLKQNKITRANAVLADLGLSSHQIDTAERGFSYMQDAKLDMRMNRQDDNSLWKLVNKTKETELAGILKEYGDEPQAKKIAANIVKNRPINTTGELAKACTGAVPSNYFKLFGHPAKRTFQALRILVNDELNSISDFLDQAQNVLCPGGRLVIISFHSGEDRIVKHALKKYESTCLCPPKTPKCICGHRPSLRVLTKKPIMPREAETRQNPRAASAKLRIAEKISE